MYAHRDQDMHNRLKVSLLYQSTIGRIAIDNPELLIFYEGFSLPVRNGFCWFEVSLFFDPYITKITNVS